MAVKQTQVGLKKLSNDDPTVTYVAGWTKLGRKKKDFMIKNINIFKA